MKRSLAVLGIILLILAGFLCTAAAESLPAPVVTVIPENPNSASWVIFRFDQVYDEVEFDLYREGVREPGGQDCLDSTDFDWGRMEAGEWRIEARARIGDVWSETFVLTFTVTQAPVLEPPVILSCPETVQAGQPISVEFELDEHADPFNCGLNLLSVTGEMLGYDNPGEDGLVVFNDWPDTIVPGNYLLELRSWDEEYDSSDAFVTWPITVTESVRPAGPDSITVLVGGEEVQTLATGDDYVLRITAPGAEAVRWELEALVATDHSKQISVNPDGVADADLSVYSWQQAPELVLKAYALRNGLWSLPVSKTVPLSDVTVAGHIGYTLDPASPREIDPVGVILDRTYERGALRLLRDGNCVDSLSLYYQDSIVLGELEAGEYTLTGRGYAEGVWTEESTFSFTVAAVERLDPPVIVSLPGSVQVGERFTLTYTADERERWADLILYDSNGQFVGFGSGSDGLVHFGPWRDDCTAGTYHGELISYSRDSNLGSSQPASFELTVTDGPRPDAPQITLNPEQPEAGRSFEFVFDRVYEALSVQLLDADSTPYTTVSDENTDRLTWQSSSAGPWTARASVCVDGIWSFSSDTPFAVLPGSGDPEVRLHAPESVSAGMPFTVSIEAVEDFYYYGVRVKDSAGKQIDESGNSDGNGIELCERGSTSLDAGVYSFVPWITSMDESIFADPIPFTVTGERPAAPACTVPAEAAVGESFTVTCDAADADWFELRVRPEGEMEPVFYDLSAASEWTVTLTSSGTYTVECWCRTDGRWSRPMTAEVIVTSAGKLPDPVISGSMSYAEGEDLVFTFASEGAEEYTYLISRPSWGNTLRGTVGPEGILTISTAEDDFFEPAGYNLTVTAHKAGWDPGETVTSFTVGGAPEAPVLTVSKDTVRVGETFTIHIEIGDADELNCDVQYDPSDPGSIGGYSGDASREDTEWDFDLPGRHFIRASVTKNGLSSAWSYAYVQVAAAETLPAPVVTVLPENPDSSSDLIFRFDQVYDEVAFDLYCDGVQDISGRDFMDSTDFLWGTLRPGEWRMEARARIGDIWSETFVLTFTVTQAPLMEPPVILSCPETVQAGQPIPVEYELDERANPFNCGVILLSADGDRLGSDNPGEAGLAVFNDWPDTVAPGNYQLQLLAWGAGYEESNSTATRPITVTESVRPAGPDGITVLMDGEEVQTLATGDDYVLRITAPGADAVRWKLEALMDSDHSRQIPVNPDGFADDDMLVSSWQQPELVLKAYALRDGLWSLPVSKTVPLSDVAVAGSVGYTLNPASPGEDDVIWVQLDREYEKAAFRLLRDGNCVRSWTWHSGEYLELGELEAGEYTLTGRGYAEGVWTEESAVSFTVAAVERLDPPEIVSLPGSVRVGERFTLTYTADEREDATEILLRDSNGESVGYGTGHNGTIQFGPWRNDCTAGTYYGLLISYSNDSNLEPSEYVRFELTVTDGPRPDAPQITLNPEQPEAGQNLDFVFDRVYEAVSVELRDADGIPHTTDIVENTDRLTWRGDLSRGSWTAQAWVCVDGIWSFCSEIPFTVVNGSGDPEVRLHAPESVSAGVPFTVSIEEVEDFFFYGVIVKDSDENRIDENGSQDGNGIELCERGSTSLDAGEYTFVPWITGRDETIFGDPIPFTVTGERPAAPACTVPAEAAAGESFTIICDAADADWFELRVKPEGEMEPVFYDLSDASEWTVTLTSSGTYTVECWCSTDGRWSLPMTAEVTVTSAGKLPDPVISGSTSYAEGEDLVFTFASEGAEEYTYVISRPSGWEPRTGTVGPEGILTVSTAGDDFFEPAGYNLTVTSRKAGWDPGETVTSFTVGGAPEAPVLTVSKDTVRVGETFTIHIGLGDADELVCDVQYDPSDPGSIGGYAGGASWADTEWDFDLPGRHFIRASVTKDGLRSAWSYVYVEVTDGSEPVPEADITTNFGSDFERPFIIGMDFEAYSIFADRVQTDPQIDYFYLNNADEIARTEAGDPVWTLDVLTGTAEYGMEESRYGLNLCITQIPQQEEDDLLRLTMTWGNVSWERAYIVHYRYSTNGLPTGIVTDLPNPLILRKGDSMDINGHAGFRDNWTPAGLPFSRTWAELEGGAWNASDQDEQGQRYAAYPGVYRDACIVVGCWNVKWLQDLELYVTEEDGTLNAADYTPKGTVFTLPAQTQRIEEEAFAGVQMTEVDIPAGVSFIAEDAFEGCGLIAIYTHNNPYVISWAVSHGIIALTD